MAAYWTRPAIAAALGAATNMPVTIVEFRAVVPPPPLALPVALPPPFPPPHAAITDRQTMSIRTFFMMNLLYERFLTSG
jgi:hypothetical protein